MLLSLGISGASAKQKSSKLGLLKLIEKVSKTTGNKFLYADRPTGDYRLYGIKINKENGMRVLGQILDEHGYTLLKRKDYFQVLHTRDIRYQDLEEVRVNKSKAPGVELPYSYRLTRYKMQHPVVGRDIVRNLRPFMSRYGRIIFSKLTGEIWIVERQNQAAKLYQLIKDSDIKPSSDYLDKKQERREHRRNVELLQAKSCAESQNNNRKR